MQGGADVGSGPCGQSHAGSMPRVEWLGGLEELRGKHALQLEEPTLGLEARTEAAKATTTGDNAMAGQDDGDRIASQGLSYSAYGGRLTQALGQLEVAQRLPVGYTSELRPHLSLEGCPHWGKRQIKMLATSREVVRQLLPHAPQELGILDWGLREELLGTYAGPRLAWEVKHRECSSSDPQRDHPEGRRVGVAVQRLIHGLEASD